jgi:hypothetical protein
MKCNICEFFKAGHKIKNGMLPPALCSHRKKEAPVKVDKNNDEYVKVDIKKKEAPVKVDKNNEKN